MVKLAGRRPAKILSDCTAVRKKKKFVYRLLVLEEIQAERLKCINCNAVTVAEDATGSGTYTQVQMFDELACLHCMMGTKELRLSQMHGAAKILLLFQPPLNPRQ